MTFSEWAKRQEFSLVSPEAHYAELAWNAAIDAALKSFEQVDSYDGSLFARVVNQLKEGQ